MTKQAYTQGSSPERARREGPLGHRRWRPEASGRAVGWRPGEGVEVVVVGGGGGGSSKHRLRAERAVTQQTRRTTLAQRSPSEFGSVSASCSLTGSLLLASAASWSCVVSEE